jgi:hypothetical protein
VSGCVRGARKNGTKGPSTPKPSGLPPSLELLRSPWLPRGPHPDAIEQLKELTALKDQGILTELEFNAQKAKNLGE